MPWRPSSTICGRVLPLPSRFCTGHTHRRIFFLGGAESVMILGEGAPTLFDIGGLARALPLNKIALGLAT